MESEEIVVRAHSSRLGNLPGGLDGQGGQAARQQVKMGRKHSDLRGVELVCRPNLNLEVQDTRIPSIAPACVTLKSLGLLSSRVALAIPNLPPTADLSRPNSTIRYPGLGSPSLSLSLSSSPLHTPLFVCLTTGCQPAEPTRDPGLGSENPFPDPSRGE